MGLLSNEVLQLMLWLNKRRQALGPHLSGPSTTSAFNLTSYDFLPKGLGAWKRLQYQI